MQPLWKIATAVFFLAACSDAEFSNSSNGKATKQTSNAEVKDPTDPNSSASAVDPNLPVETEETGGDADTGGGDGGTSFFPEDTTSDLGEPGWHSEGSADDLEKVSDGDVKVSEVAKTYWMTCQQNETTGIATIYRGSPGTKVRATGELCLKSEPATQQALTVLFIVDLSGSMTKGIDGKVANDPLVNKSCGRLEATQKVVAKAATLTGYSSIKIAAIGFSQTAKTLLPLTAMASATSKITYAAFCDGDNGTNYQAAFDAAKAMLLTVKGPKAVYFVSDGEPESMLVTHTFFGRQITEVESVSTDRARAAGLASAKALFTAVPDLTLSAFYLNKNTVDVVDIKGYLAQLTGSADRVKLVSDAETLVQEVDNATIPDAQLLKSQTSAVLSSPDAANRSVGIASLVRHKTEKNRWIYNTEPFELQGEVGKSVINTLTVTAKPSSGETAAAKLSIDFTAE